MKYLPFLILFGLLIWCGISLAQPAYLKGGVITVTLTDGNAYTFSSDEYMVVKRHAVAAPVVAAESEETEAVETIAAVESVEEYPNHITLHGGVGRDYSIKALSPNHVQIKDNREFVFGATVSHKIGGHKSVSGTMLSNETYLLGIGTDF